MNIQKATLIITFGVDIEKSTPPPLLPLPPPKKKNARDFGRQKAALLVALTFKSSYHCYLHVYRTTIVQPLQTIHHYYSSFLLLLV